MRPMRYGIGFSEEAHMRYVICSLCYITYEIYEVGQPTQAHASTCVLVLSHHKEVVGDRRPKLLSASAFSFTDAQYPGVAL